MYRPLSLYTYIYIYIYAYTYIYTYKRERERERYYYVYVAHKIPVHGGGLGRIVFYQGLPNGCFNMTYQHKQHVSYEYIII